VVRILFSAFILIFGCCGCGLLSNQIQKSGEWDRIHYGEYLIENNTWNVSAFHSTWQQNIFCDTTTGTCGWNWDFSDEKNDLANDVVKTYPEIIFGRKPYDGYQSTTQRLPVSLVSAKFSLEYDYSAKATGTYNTTTDISFTDITNPGPANIRAKMMIWFDGQTMPFFPSHVRKKAVIGGRQHEVFINLDHIGPEGRWVFIALMPIDLPLNGKLNLKEYIDYALSERALKPEWYLSSIEIGSEIVSGTGEIIFKRFVVHE
jgi:hypothetical protein